MPYIKPTEADITSGIDEDVFSYFYLPHAFIKEVLNYEVKPFHKKWLDHVRKNDRALVLAPRGHGKSSIITIAYPIWRALIDPKMRILIVSSTISQAESFLVEIRNQLSYNEKISEIFGDVQGSRWHATELSLKNHGPRKEPSFAILAMGSGMVGRHFDLIILDDICDEITTRNQSQRDKQLVWFYKTLSPMLEPNGEMIIVGTRWHEGDLYNHLITSGEFKSKIYSAIQDEKKKEVLWPERFSWDKLQEIRKQSGSYIFALQYQNQIVSKENAIFKESWIQRYVEPPQNLKTYMGVDLASSSKGDYFAICVVGRQEGTGNLYILNLFRDHLSLSQQIEKIVQFGETYKALKIGIESNAYQKVVPDELKARTSLPIKAISYSMSKEERAIRRSVLFENKMVYLPSTERELTDELLLFPRARHDDLFDAFCLAITASEKYEYDWNSVKDLIYTGTYNKSPRKKVEVEYDMRKV